MFSRLLAARVASRRPWTTRTALALVGVALFGVACADRIVSVDAGTGSHAITAGVGDLVDIRLWGGGSGTYVSPPAISGGAVVFIDVFVDGPPVPGGPTQRFRFRAASRGRAVVTFSPQQSAPVVVDTIVVQ